MTETHLSFCESRPLQPLLRVLVADDHAVNRAFATELLAYFGARVAKAANGAEAVQLVADGHEFDLVLMDVQMPVMNGLLATARIRQLERERNHGSPLRIVALTSEAIPPDQLNLRRLGFDALLTKPLTVTTLAVCLRRCFPGALRADRPSRPCS